ncbi:hypothetical protein ERO13_D04G184801v2, partial [Gossypium hirsutum]
MEPSTNIERISSGEPEEPEENITYMDALLYKAAAEGRIEEFNSHPKLQLESLKTPNHDNVLHCPSLLLQKNAKGQTPLHVAARNGHSAIVKLLIRSCAKARDGDLEKLGMDQVNAVREMLRITDQESDTALHVAAQYGDVEMVEGLLELEDPDFPYSANKNQKTPLYLAAEIGNRGVLSVLLDKSKSTAAMAEDAEATKIILKKKGNLTKERDEDGHTPLHYAAHKCCSSVVEELLKWDASAAYVCDRKLGMTPLLMAARQAHLQKSQKIHSFCPDCCVKVDNRGWNLLHFLAFRVYPPRIAIYFFTLSRKMECASIRNLMDWKDALGITPHQVYDAYRPRIARARKSFENSGQKEKKKQIEELLKDIAREEVAECP